MSSTHKPSNLTLLNNWVQAFGNHHGLQIAFNSQGIATVKLHNRFDLVIKLSKNAESIKLFSYIGAEKDQGNMDLLQKLLKYNFSADIMNGCSIGLCQDTGRFVLITNIAMKALSETLFENLIFNYAETLIKLEEVIIKEEQSHASTSADHLAPMPLIEMNKPDHNVHLIRA